VSCLVLLAGCRTLGGPQIAPDQDVNMDPRVLDEFREEVEEYVRLHEELLKRVPTVTPQSSPQEIAAHRQKMTEAIRAERAGVKQGDIFEPPVAAAFRALLRKELTGPEGPAMLEEIRTGNPKVEGTPSQQNPNKEVRVPVQLAVNAVYPDAAPASTVPAGLLLKMPRLPDEVKYGFVGRALILRDTHANVILDFVADAVPDRSLPR
jgi:hypothetical protein